MSVTDSRTEDSGKNFGFGPLYATAEELSPSPYNQLTEIMRTASLLSSTATGNSDSAAKVAPAPAPAEAAPAPAKQVCLSVTIGRFNNLLFSHSATGAHGSAACAALASRIKRPILFLFPLLPIHLVAFSCFVLLRPLTFPAFVVLLRPLTFPLSALEYNNFLCSESYV
jgi:hypothetical protein